MMRVIMMIRLILKMIMMNKTLLDKFSCGMTATDSR